MMCSWLGRSETKKASIFLLQVNFGLAAKKSKKPIDQVNFGMAARRTETRELRGALAMQVTIQFRLVF